MTNWKMGNLLALCCGLQTTNSSQKLRRIVSNYDDRKFLTYLKGGRSYDDGIIHDFLEHIYNDREYSQGVAEMALKSKLLLNVLHRPLDEDLIELATKMNKSKYPVVEIIRKYPSTSRFLLPLFDASILENGEDSDCADFSISLNFDLLLPPDKEEGEIKERHFEPEMEVLSEIIEVPKLEPYRDAILKHPLVKAYVALKWKRFQPFALLSLGFYILLSVLMTIYIMKIQLAACRVKLDLAVMGAATNPTTTNERQFWSMFTLMINRPQLEKHNKLTTPCQELAVFQLVLIPIIVLMILIVLVLEVMEMWMYGRRYWKHFGNILQWVYIIFGAVTIVPVNMVISREVLYTQYQLAAFGILAIWSLLLIQASKFKGLARYVDMLAQVIKSFVGFILAFGCLFVGFTLCALILFSNFPSTETLPRSLLKILVSMIGGFSYEENFYRDVQEAKGADGGALMEKHILLYPASSHIFLMIFTVVCSMALMNLLVALAVVDVEVMLQRAEGIMLRRMVNEICHTEKVLYKFSHVFSRIPEWFRLQNYARVNIGDKMEGRVQKTLFPNSDSEKSLDKEMLVCILSFVEKRRAKLVGVN